MNGQQFLGGSWESARQANLAWRSSSQSFGTARNMSILAIVCRLYCCKMNPCQLIDGCAFQCGSRSASPCLWAEHVEFVSLRIISNTYNPRSKHVYMGNRARGRLCFARLNNLRTQYLERLSYKSAPTLNCPSARTESFLQLLICFFGVACSSGKRLARV